MGNGLAQGAVTMASPKEALSPILFLIFTTDASHRIHIPVKVFQYADDIGLLYTHKDPEVAANTLKAVANNFAEIMIQKGIPLSPPKSKLMIFSNR